MDPHKFLESFIQASSDKNKMLQFDLKYSVSHSLRLIQEHLGVSFMQDLPSSTTSSSFQLLQQTIAFLASSCHGGSQQNMPQIWKDLISMQMSDPPVTKQPAKTSPTDGSKLKELEIVGVHEEITQNPNAVAIISSDNSDNTSNIVTPPNPSVNPTRPNYVTSMASDSYSINMPMAPSATPPPPPPHEDNINKLGFTVFAVELVGALTNVAVSSKSKHNQLLVYVVVACSTLAFFISSTALVLHKKLPAIAKKMQKAAFLIGTFGILGIMGMLLPSTMITWCFTISAFLVFMLMFIVANLIM